MNIPFNQPFVGSGEPAALEQVFLNRRFSGDGLFTERASKNLESLTGSPKVLLTHSCTAALEMAALLIGLGEGDEVIVPSFTFTTSASCFALRGAVPVFVDIDMMNMNIDVEQIEKAITPRTKAIVVVHYAGRAADMGSVMSLANSRGLFVIEDAAQAIGSFYEERALGSIGHFGAISFHETKNVMCGEGGALLINDPAFVEKAEIIREKGTDRKKFFRGEVDKYTWREIGSSFLLSELNAAVLSVQLSKLDYITKTRLKLCKIYLDLLQSRLGAELEYPLQKSLLLNSNGHMFYLLTNDGCIRDNVLKKMRDAGVMASSHYEPLHLSPCGKKHGMSVGSMENTLTVSSQIIRLPLWIGLTLKEQEYVVQTLATALKG